MTPWAEGITSGDIRALARAATAVENRDPAAQTLLREIFPHTGRARVIGITGPPGAGKSTLVDALISAVRSGGETVGVLAVDPTSPYSGGAILGDRIRMQSHYADSGVFIRSMATRGCLGGLARTTMDMVLLLDAAGKEIVFVETVGVGQDEVEVARLADVTVVVLMPGMGDDVQALKAGILEIADVFVINKADLPGAERVERELKAVLSLAKRADGWAPPVVRTIATEGKGIGDALAAARRYLETRPPRAQSAGAWTLRLREMLCERLMERVAAEEVESCSRDVAAHRRDPYSVVEEWLGRL